MTSLIPANQQSAEPAQVDQSAGVTQPAQVEKPAAAASRARIVITPPGRWRLPVVSHLWEAREVLLRFGSRDVTLRYRQTFLGVAWVVLQPLMSAGVFTLVFGRVARLPSGGVPYFLFSFAGMLAWNVFNGVASRAATSLVQNAALVSKVFFPRVLVPLSTVYAVLLDFVVGFAFMVVLLFAYRVNPGWAVVLTPLWLAGALLLASGIGVVCAALMVKYRDIQFMLPFVLQLLLYASPVAYSLDAVPSKYVWIYDVNPLTWTLQEFRWSLLGQAMPPAWQIIGSFVVPAVVFLLGMVIFEQMERGFADVI